MSQFAQIVDGAVAQLSPTDKSTKNDVWIFCTANVQVGWLYSNFTFTPAVIAQQPPPQYTDLQVFIGQVHQALQNTDITMARIQEAVSLGVTTWTTPDVVTYINYRRYLRSMLSATSVGTLPTAAPYPAGT